MMREVQGDATFKSFPGESFRFGVGETDGVGEIWLASQVSKKRWACEVADVAAFAPADVVLPLDTVLHYVAANLKESADANRGPNLVRDEDDKILHLEVLIKLGVADFTWAPKYVFPLTLESHMSPTETRAEQIEHLTTEVQKLQQEVKTLKKQMHKALQRQVMWQPAAVPPSAWSISGVSRPSSELVVSKAVNTVSNQETALATPLRGAKAGDGISGHTQHRLVQTGEFREIRNAVGMIVRSHRQHTCKVCSLLQRNYKRPSGTSYYCLECTERHNGGMVFLCDKIRPHDPTEYKNASCSQIWHLMWNNGEDIPASGASLIRMRKRKKKSHPDESETSVSTVLARPLP